MVSVEPGGHDGSATLLSQPFGTQTPAGGAYPEPSLRRGLSKKAQLEPTAQVLSDAQTSAVLVHVPKHTVSHALPGAQSGGGKQ